MGEGDKLRLQGQDRHYSALLDILFKGLCVLGLLPPFGLLAPLLLRHPVTQGPALVRVPCYISSLQNDFCHIIHKWEPIKFPLLLYPWPVRETKACKRAP